VSSSSLCPFVQQVLVDTKQNDRSRPVPDLLAQVVISQSSLSVMCKETRALMCTEG